MERLGVDALDVDAAQMTHVQVWLIDQHDRNPHIDAVLLGAAQAIAKLGTAAGLVDTG